MRIAHLVLAGIAGTMAALAPVPSARADSPATQPADLASYSDLIKKCEDYDRFSNNWKWTTIYTADFRPGQPVTWHPDPQATDMANNPNPNAVQTSLQREDGHDELVINGQACNCAFLDVGPKVRGDMAVDMVCKSIGRLNDLSIIIGPYHYGPGFQFGAFGNTKSVLWPGAPANQDFNAVQSVDCQGSPTTFQANQWYHVRLEVKDGQVRGLVDGHEVGKIAINPAFPSDLPHQPFLYTWNSVMVVRAVHVEAYAPDPHGVDPAEWSKVFGAEDQASVQKEIDGLVRLLADRDPATRDKVEHIVVGMGALTIPALQRAATSDVPELKVRAASILKTISAAGRPAGHG